MAGPCSTLRFGHHSTIALVPPSTTSDRWVWDRLQGTRATLRDRGYYRWPPHVNLIYPFVDPSSNAHVEVLPALAAAAASVMPFRVTLKSLGTFGGQNRGVLWLDPEVMESDNEAIYYLQSKLLAALPPTHPAPLPAQLTRFRPHLTLCHFPTLAAADAAAADLAGSFAAAPVSFEVAEVYVMERRGDDGQFHVVARLPLGGGGGAQCPSLLEEAAAPVNTGLLRFPYMPQEEAAWVREVRGEYKDGRTRRGRRGGAPGGPRPPQQGSEPREGHGPARRGHTADTPEQIAEKRAARAAKRLALEALSQVGGHRSLP